MANKIQIRRGLKSTLTVLSPGELGYTTDSKELFIGNASGGNTQFQNFNTPNAGLFRQALINGNFDIWQRGTTFNTVASLQYTADRWKHSNAIDNNVKVMRSSDVPNSSSVYSMRLEQMTAVGGASAFTDAYQRIEDFAQFRGKQITFSGWVKVDTGVSVIPMVGDGVGNSQGSAITVPGWTFFSVTHNVSASATELYPLLRLIRNGLAIGKGCYYAQLQLNIGEIALPVQPRCIADELALCQRYFQLIKAQYFRSPPSSFTTATETGIIIKLSQNMRVSPTVTIGGTRGTDWQLFNSAGIPNNTGILTQFNYGTDYVVVYFTGGTFLEGAIMGVTLMTTIGEYRFDAEL